MNGCPGISPRHLTPQSLCIAEAAQQVGAIMLGDSYLDEVMESLSDTRSRLTREEWRDGCL